jgi:hypothetical protein
MGPNTAQAADKEKQLGSARIEGEYSGPANAARLAYEAQLEALKNKDKLGKDLKAQQAQAQTALGASTALNQLRQLYTKAVTPRTAIGKGASMAGTLGNMAMAFGTGGAVGGGFDPINMVKNSVAASHPVLGSYFAPDVVKYTTTKEGLLPLLNAALGHVRWSKYERDALDSLVPDVNENPATANAKWQKLQFLVATGPLLSKLGPDDPNDPEGSFMTKMATMDRWQRLVESTPPGHDTAFDAVTGLEIPTFQGGPIAGPQPKKK